MRTAASDARVFFGALLIPMTAGVALALSAVYFGPRGPLVALLVNAFLMSQVAGVGRVAEIPMPAGYFRLRSFERFAFCERLGIRPFKALLMRWFDAAAWLMAFNILGNGYPVMLQRYNRLRVEKLVR